MAEILPDGGFFPQNNISHKQQSQRRKEGSYNQTNAENLLSITWAQQGTRSVIIRLFSKCGGKKHQLHDLICLKAKRWSVKRLGLAVKTFLLLFFLN